MIKNHNGIAELSVHKDGPKTAVVYRTVNDEVIVARGSGMSEALAMMANEVGGFPLRFDYPDELNLEPAVAEKGSTSIERFEEPASPELDFDAPATPPHKDGGGSA
ncbi:MULTISPECIES: hypothetical protein [Halorussus]|uniref:hypothetical protein n=1 Tax=Halorussus TaxID=1070314 RepID=UPI0020A20A38|nr:hypothetical protein [Halorussus vallis]USZ75750.1 hypothetical protein NGM07_00115 [Halorussus vallis]